MGCTGRVKNKASAASSKGVYEEDVIEPLLNCPYFHIIFAKSHVQPPYQLIFPTKVHGMLPESLLHVVLNNGGKEWEMKYLGNDKHHKRLNPAWKHFVLDNNLKIGDGCVFELIHVDDKIARFKVQILRGDLPEELLFKLKSCGDSSENPITINC